MSRLLLQLRLRRELNFPVFDDYLKAVQQFAIGNDRLYWNRMALSEQDQKLEEVNQQFRDKVHQACHEIIEQLTSETSAG